MVGPGKEIAALLALNQHTDYKAEPGLLGDLARENNVLIAVLVIVM